MNWRHLSLNEKYSLVLYFKEQGKSQVEIAEIFDMHKSTIRIFCRDYKIDDWPKGGREGNMNARRNETPCKKTISKLARRAAIEAGKDLFLCEGCGFRNPIDEWPKHHKDRNKLNNDPGNIEILCDSCHALEHINERERNALGQLL